jgi:hydrogenase maturation protease
MKPILVIGCGNPLRSDDGVGRHAARQIAATVSQSDVAVLVRHQLTPDLAEPVYKARFVIFIDASGEDPPGKIRSRRLVPESAWPCLLMHHLTPAGLLACAKAIYGNCPPAVLYSVGAKRFDFNDVLSDDVYRRLPELLTRIRRQIIRQTAHSNDSDELKAQTPPVKRLLPLSLP